MNKLMLAITILVLLVATPVRTAFAEDSYSQNTTKKTFMDMIIEKVNAFINGNEAQASADSVLVINEEKTDLAKILNRKELLIRVKITGRDLYLQRDAVLPEVDAFMSFLDSSTVADDKKAPLLKSLGKIRKIYLMDLVDAPQDELKPAVLDFFDTAQSIVLTLDDKEAAELLAYLTSRNLN